MKLKAVSLLSGGLDSTLATRIVMDQNVEIFAVNFQTMFQCCKDDAGVVARDLGIPFMKLTVGKDYLEMVQKPKHGYGRGINPCIDCRGFMFDLAKKYMTEIGASFLISGEVLGQRPMSQKKRDFRLIERDTELEGKILRPLSAKLLPETDVEKEGLIDRELLFDIQGRGRHRLLKLAKQYGIKDVPQPSVGCSLTQPDFSKKVKDVFAHKKDYEVWEFEILKTGRHFRIDASAKVVIGRNQNECAWLESVQPDGATYFECQNFGGPSALLLGEETSERIEKTCGIILRYAQKPLPETPQIAIKNTQRNSVVETAQALSDEMIEPWRIV